MPLEYEESLSSKIEEALEKELPRRWSRLAIDKIRGTARWNKLALGWRIRLPKSSPERPLGNVFYILIDDDFPLSEPKVYCEEAISSLVWPHMESNGKLCLKRTRLQDAPEKRILDCISWILELLAFDDARIADDYIREIQSYWNVKVQKQNPSFLSLLEIKEESRFIEYAFEYPYGKNYGKKKNYIFADQPAKLMNWLKHKNIKFHQRNLRKSFILWPNPSITPDKFPKTADELLQFLSHEQIDLLIYSYDDFPFLIGYSTPSGPCFVGMLISSARSDKIGNGFRTATKIAPIDVLKSYLKKRSLIYRAVKRIDPEWIHGRGYNPDITELQQNKVAIVGCGALGGTIAYRLAQSGVGSLLLIDHDTLAPANISRHLLGEKYVSWDKSEALAHHISVNFPHIKEINYYVGNFSDACKDAETSKRLRSSDIVLSAGISTEGDLMIDKWRKDNKNHCVHICSWAEAYAQAGHALAIFEDHSFSNALDDNYAINFAVTDWPNDMTFTEAGCGTSFQPHSVIDLDPVAYMACSLALDVLSTNIHSSCRRTWYGNRDKVIKLGGKPNATFDGNFHFQEISWP